MDSTFEVCRQTHEELDRFERALYTLLSRPNPTHDVRLKNEHKAAQVLDRIEARVSQLNNLYGDTQARQAEIGSLSSAAGDLTEFYGRLRRIQEHHAKYPDAAPGGFDLEIATFLDEPEEGEEEYEEDPILLMFSGEEGYGKYVDLYANHVAYCNLKNIGKRPGYLQYLDLLLTVESQPLHDELSKDTRLSKEYATYIKDLYNYLISFAKRAQPLNDIEAQLRDAENEFTRKWEAGELSEWQASQKTNGESESAGIWCAACQKNYSKQTVYDAHLTSKKHIKAAAKQGTNGEAAQANGASHHSASTPTPAHTSQKDLRTRTAAFHTHLSATILKTLIGTLNETKSNVERRFSLTAREREQELEEQRTKKPVVATSTTKEDGEEEEEEEEEERIYNPLKLPLGWDGKPIPYWLYKLHGLGVEYRCEICSDHVYMGRKNFDRHFQESRHAFGMRALGLPNTKHFHEITKIADALALAEKLKQEGRHEIFEQETMEELEDDEGNVYSRKTYEDLKKQGII